MAVLVLDRQKKPLMPCSEKRARLLLARRRAVVVRVYPFTLRLKDRAGGAVQKVVIKIDPGSKETGMAVSRISAQGEHVLCLIELIHRGRQISKALVRFDLQQMNDLEIIGVEYQQGTLLGYEVREYLLEKWGRECAYCTVTDTPLEIEHIVSKANGGSNRISNLTIACHDCNQEKGSQTLTEFFQTSSRLKDKQPRMDNVLIQCRRPLRDAAAVNSTRWALFQSLKTTELSVNVGTGGQTKFNRQRLGIPKTHALDAACVGIVEQVFNWEKPTLRIKATGRGSYKRTRLTKHGFPRGYLMREKSVYGFQTGDMVRAIVPTGKKEGTWLGRVAIRKTGSFNIQTSDEAVQGIHHRHCQRMQRADGYGYHLHHKKEKGNRKVCRADARRALPPRPERTGFPAQNQ
jgi:5-methylcytosine-specific restriction endonuclease McrA